MPESSLDEPELILRDWRSSDDGFSNADTMELCNKSYGVINCIFVPNQWLTQSVCQKEQLTEHFVPTNLK